VKQIHHEELEDGDKERLNTLLISREYQKADTVLQLSDLFTQRRLGDLQSVGGTPEVEVLRQEL
jgi:hypothetical protein